MLEIVLIVILCACVILLGIALVIEKRECERGWDNAREMYRKCKELQLKTRKKEMNRKQLEEIKAALEETVKRVAKTAEKPEELEALAAVVNALSEITQVGFKVF